MAGFEVEFPDDFLSELFETGADDICEQALKDAAPIMEAEMKRVLKQDGHELSGELIASIKSTSPKKSKNGAWIVNVRPTGYSTINSFSVKRKGNRIRKFSVSNALKMLWIEYGVNGRQPARPFLTRVTNQVGKATMEKMQETYNRMVDAK